MTSAVVDFSTAAAKAQESQNRPPACASPAAQPEKQLPVSRALNSRSASEGTPRSSIKEKARQLLHQMSDFKKVSKLRRAPPSQSKTFDGIPHAWHQTIKVRNPETLRVKLYFRCRHSGCGSIFKKSCNLRDHFRKHTGQRPFTCPKCQKTFTQSGNLGRHLKNVHAVPRESISYFKRQAKATGPTQWEKDAPDDTLSEAKSEMSLVHMTCKEFE